MSEFEGEFEDVSRCDICNKPFIYGSFVGDTFKKNDNSGRQQVDGRWTHDECFEKESE